MIVKSTWRRAGGLEAHLLRTDTNETVQVRTDLCRGADDLHAALRLMEALTRTNPRVARTFVHVVISPDHAMTEAELAEALAMVEAEHGLSSVLRAVVEHLKGARATHVHAVYPVVDLATGRAIRSNDNFTRDELISRRLELAFGERIIPGPRLEANISELERRGLRDEAERLVAHAPVRQEDGLSRRDRRQAERLGVDASQWSTMAFDLFEGADHDLAAFAREIENSGYTVARGEEAMLLVDDETGFHTSLVRLLRREAKAVGRPLDIAERDVVAAFPDAPAFNQARDLGLARARAKAEREVEVERRAATHEALIDGDSAELEAFRKERHRARAEAETQDRIAFQATLKARRQEISAFYRQRDALRRRRVDRAFQAARLFDTPAFRRLAFALAAAGMLMTGGSLALAIGGGIVAMDLLPTRARARVAAAAAQRERAEDAARRRSEADAAYRDVRTAARQTEFVRFTFDHVPKPDRVLAGYYVEMLLQGASLSPEARVAAGALGPEIVTGLTRMLERGSPVQVRRLRHWHRGIAPERRGPAVAAALSRHAGAPSRPPAGDLKKPSRVTKNRDRKRSSNRGYDVER